MKVKQIALLLALMVMAVNLRVYAQGNVNLVPAQDIMCGDLLEGEFLTPLEERTYSLSADAGTTVSISITAIAQQPKMFVLLTDPSNFGLAISDGRMDAAQTVYFPGKMQSQNQLTDLVLPATGKYKIRLVNFVYRNFNFATNDYMVFQGDGLGGTGLYSISLTCIDRFGDPIPPLENTNTNTETQSNDTQGTVAPNLIPDFSSTPRIPLTAGLPMGGGLSADANIPSAYTIDGSKDQQLTLEINRLAGNLNVAVVLISPTNEVMNFSSLIGSKSLTISTLLPDNGTYTIGVFRVDLLTPASPENTAFQLQASLSS